MQIQLPLEELEQARKQYEQCRLELTNTTQTVNQITAELQNFWVGDRADRIFRDWGSISIDLAGAIKTVEKTNRFLKHLEQLLIEATSIDSRY